MRWARPLRRVGRSGPSAREAQLEAQVEGLTLPLGEAGVAALSTGPDQVWQLGFFEEESTSGGTWRVTEAADYFSRV